MMADPTSTKLFLQLSATLTGYSTADLQGTSLVDAYYNEVLKIVGGRIFGRLLITWESLPVPGASLEDSLRDQILNSDLLGPIARNIIKMWYVGNWNQLPRAWRQIWGAHADDRDRVISAHAFREGLMWDAIGAHPPTAKSPGFGTWAYPLKGAPALDCDA